MNLTKSLKIAAHKRIIDPIHEELADQPFQAQTNRLILTSIHRNELCKMPKGNSFAKA
jgi:hypothetical protein